MAVQVPPLATVPAVLGAAVHLPLVHVEPLVAQSAGTTKLLSCTGTYCKVEHAALTQGSTTMQQEALPEVAVQVPPSATVPAVLGAAVHLPLVQVEPLVAQSAGNTKLLSCSGTYCKPEHTGPSQGRTTRSLACSGSTGAPVSNSASSAGRSSTLAAGTCGAACCAVCRQHQVVVMQWDLLQA